MGMSAGPSQAQQIDIQVGRQAPWVEVVSAIAGTFARTPVSTEWRLKISAGDGIQATRTIGGQPTQLASGPTRVSVSERDLAAVEQFRAQWEGRAVLADGFLQSVRSQLASGKS